MPKKKSHNKDRPSRSKSCKPNEAATEALYNYIIISAIFANLKDKVILTRMQRVCRTWRDVAGPRLRRHSQLPPIHDQTTDSHIMKFNRLLTPHFQVILSNPGKSPEIKMQTAYEQWWDGCALSMSIANVASGKRKHLAFIRQDASWRDMLVSTPPIYQVRFIDMGYVKDGGGRERSEMVHVQEGLRMGQLYDLVASIITRSAKNGVHAVQLEWPANMMKVDRSAPYWRRRTDSQKASHSYLTVRKTGESVPVSDIWEMERFRKWQPRYTASNKWRLLSEGFDKKNLIVNPWE